MGEDVRATGLGEGLRVHRAPGSLLTSKRLASEANLPFSPGLSCPVPLMAIWPCALSPRARQA